MDRLFTPGPLNTSDATRLAMNADLGSRTPVMTELTQNIRDQLLAISELGDEFESVLMQGSGTFSVEAMLSSLVTETDQLLILDNGVYGDRMVKIAVIHDLPHQVLKLDPMRPVNLNAVKEALSNHPNTSQIAVVHFETDLGVLNDMQALANLAEQYDCSLLIDAMSSFGAYPIPPNSVLAVAASANKCLHGVPGVGFVIAQRQALQAESKPRSLSLDLKGQWRGFEKNGQWRFTPPIQVLLALHQAIQEFVSVGGMRARFEKYQAMNAQLVAGLAELNIQPVIAGSDRAPMITTFVLPENFPVSLDDLFSGLLDQGLVIYPSSFKPGLSFRVGCMGELEMSDVGILVAALCPSSGGTKLAMSEANSGNLREGPMATFQHREQPPAPPANAVISLRSNSVFLPPEEEGIPSILSKLYLNNRTTGPTPVPDFVAETLTLPMINHRGKTFQSIEQSVSEKLQALLNTTATPLLFTSSGTGGLEAMTLNLIKKDAPVLALSAGYYGDLFANIADHYLPGQVTRLSFEPGTGIDPEKVAQALQQNAYETIIFTHNESSAGVLNALPAIIKAIREHSDALILVDAISSAGLTEIQMDEWGVDALVTAPQKALMCPPGLSMILVNDRAIERFQSGSVLGSYYFDFEKALNSQATNQTPFTPNVLTIRALDAALSWIFEQGLEAVYGHQQKMAEFCRSAVQRIGFELFADEAVRSPGLTAVRMPVVGSSAAAKDFLETECQLAVTQGVGNWKNNILRIGHMGWVPEADLSNAIKGFERLWTSQYQS